MKLITHIAAILLIIGGINWGLIGIFNFNLVGYLLEHLYLDRVVYWLVGLSAIWMIFAYPIILKKIKARV
jgi:uncharacterized protein